MTVPDEMVLVKKSWLKRVAEDSRCSYTRIGAKDWLDKSLTYPEHKERLTALNDLNELMGCGMSGTREALCVFINTHQRTLRAALSATPKQASTYAALEHEYYATRGLFCIDKDPAEVDHAWIKQNAFQLENYIEIEAPKCAPATMREGDVSAPLKALRRLHDMSDGNYEARYAEYEGLKNWIESIGLLRVEGTRK